MAARNKPVLFKSLRGEGLVPPVIELPVQAGSTQAIKTGEICKLRSISDFSTYPIVPAAAGEKEFIPIIAIEEQSATDIARLMKFYIPIDDFAFEFALDAATEVKLGDGFQINDSQSVKIATAALLGTCWIEPITATPTWQSVSKAFVVFNRIAVDNFIDFPLMGGLSREMGLKHVIADPGDAEAIPVTSDGYCPIVTAKPETRTVANPSYAGQELLLMMKTDAGDCVITFAAAFSEDGDTTITLDDAGDMARFVAIYVGTGLRWRAVAIQGATSVIASTLANALADPGDAGAIPVTENGYCPLVTAAGETRTMAIPAFAGQQILLELKTDVGDCVITVASAFEEDGDTTLTLDTAGDWAMFTAIEVGAVLAWRLTAQRGVADVANWILGNKITDPGDAGAVPVLHSGFVELVTAGAETRTLAAPTRIGQQLLLTMKTDGGDCVLTVATGLTQEGQTILTFDDVGDSALLIAVESGASLLWRIVYADGLGKQSPIIDAEDTSDHLLIPADLNPNGLIIKRIYGRITEVMGGDTEDQGVITVYDESNNALATLTPTDGGADGVGDIIVGYQIDASTTGDALKTVAAGEFVDCKITQATSGSNVAGKMQVIIEFEALPA